MKYKKEKFERQYLVITTASVFVLLGLTNFAFSEDSASAIKNRAKGKCDNCGHKIPRHQLIAAHINHDKTQPDYDSVDNGRCLCRLCEAIYHISNANNAVEIGMNQRDAVDTAFSTFQQLNPNEKESVKKKLEPGVLEDIFAQLRNRRNSH